MTNRKEKIKEMMENFQSLRRGMMFRAAPSKGPRITPSQWGVLMIIGNREANVKDVAQALGISSSAATQLIDGLVASGYLVREQNAQDRRKVTLTLSPKSKKQVEKMREQSVGRFLKFFEALNDKEFDYYMRLNKKIINKNSKQ